MPPTLGRIVLFRPAAGAPSVELRPAVITRVWSTECVNLEVFGPDDNGADGKHPTSVMFDATGTAPRSWSWPARV